jgi:hypothetical protein
MRKKTQDLGFWTMVYQKENKKKSKERTKERDVLDVPTKNRILGDEGVVRERVKVYRR